MTGRGQLRWRKASRSGNSGANCVEIARGPWRKASRSNNTGANCVELSGHLVRDSKNPSGPHLCAGVESLITAIKAGQFAH